MKKRPFTDRMAGFRNYPNQNRCTMYHQMNNNGLLYPPQGAQPQPAHNQIQAQAHQNVNLMQQHQQNQLHHFQHQQNYNHHHHHVMNTMNRHYIGQQQLQQQTARHHVMNVSTNIPLNASEYFIHPSASSFSLVNFFFFDLPLQNKTETNKKKHFPYLFHMFSAI